MQQRRSATHLKCWLGAAALSLFLYVDGTAISDIPSALRDSHERKKTERQSEKVMKTKQILKISAAPATALFAMAFVAMATPAAAAVSIDYCRHDVTSGMRGCGYTSLEQCQAMSSGRGGSCYENPFPENSAKASSGAYAYQPKYPVSKSARKPVDNR